MMRAEAYLKEHETPLPQVEEVPAEPARAT
jgi:hypothetical protein